MSHNFTRRWLLASLMLAACNGASASPALSEPSKSDPTAEAESKGTLLIKAESRRYVEVSTATYDDTQAVLRVPAHAAFKDGAVAQLGAPMEGRVSTIHVKVGDNVKRGDALVTLQSPAAATARADLSAAHSALKAATMGVERQTKMLDDGVGIASEKFQADIDLEKAKADLARAERTSSYLGEGSGATVVVRAPIDGTVLERDITVGAVADPNGQPMLAIGDPNAVWIVADVFERDLARIAVGAAVDLELANQSAPVHGQVKSIGSVVSAGLRSAPVYVEVQGASSGLRAGMFARANINVESSHSVTLPVSAVLIKDGHDEVVLLETEPNHFMEQKVTTGQPVDGRVPVLRGLNPGDHVVTKGALLIDSSGEQLL